MAALPKEPSVITVDVKANFDRFVQATADDVAGDLATEFPRLMSEENCRRVAEAVLAKYVLLPR